MSPMLHGNLHALLFSWAQGIKAQQASGVKPNAVNCRSVPAALNRAASLQGHTCMPAPFHQNPWELVAGTHSVLFIPISTDPVKSTAADLLACHPLHPFCAPLTVPKSIVAGFLLHLGEPRPTSKAAALMRSALPVVCCALKLRLCCCRLPATLHQAEGAPV